MVMRMISSATISVLNLFIATEKLSLKQLENYPIMALKTSIFFYSWFIFAIVIMERILIGHILKFKDQSIFYKNFRSNMLFTYLLLIYFSDEDAFTCVPDFFIYIAHFTFYAGMATFKTVLDTYCKNILASQVSYDSIPEAHAKIEKMKYYYNILKYIQLAFVLSSIIIFSEVDKLRLYCLYAPGINVLID
mmetsp:Transcript_1078/g.952  ORF Transcript_1078/g.952 Transcript_1078/m.952 type:complete len:191 (+) Transcript_1078:3-575(+)